MPVPDRLLRFTEPVRVLDHGFVQLLDVMGDDAAVEEAARVSYQAGTIPQSDIRTLIRYMMRNKHGTPFEMAEIKLRIKLPIFVERQMVRHRMGSTNEMSARYSILPEEFYVPTPDQVCYQDKKNKQGRAEPVPDDLAEGFIANLVDDSEEAFRSYRLALGTAENPLIARETARLGLPLNTYTMKIWKMDLRNLLITFLAMRADAHAQWEIREYANAILDIVKEWVPLSYEAWLDYVFEAHTFSRQEMSLLRTIAREWNNIGSPLNRKSWKSIFDAYDAGTVRERGEFLRALGIKLEG